MMDMPPDLLTHPEVLRLFGCVDLLLGTKVALTSVYGDLHGCWAAREDSERFYASCGFSFMEWSGEVFFSLLLPEAEQAPSGEQPPADSALDGARHSEQA
jgi:hypothetical protein